MNAIALTISNIPVRQDSFGRFCLNDLHKAAGGEKRHAPNEWLRTQQAQDVIAELSTDYNLDDLTGNSRLAPVETFRGGKTPGTFGIKEAVYSYAMWISAKFHIAVIRAYDAMVTGSTKPIPPDRKTKKALPGCLTVEMQDHIKSLVKARAARVESDKAASTIIKTWAAIKSKFGCPYKEIPQEEYLNVVSLIERLPIEGELIAKPMPEIKKTTDDDFDNARVHLRQLKEIGRAALDDSLQSEYEESLRKLERCLVRAWTEIDESLFRIRHAQIFLERWRGSRNFAE